MKLIHLLPDNRGLAALPGNSSNHFNFCHLKMSLSISLGTFFVVVAILICKAHLFPYHSKDNPYTPALILDSSQLTDFLPIVSMGDSRGLLIICYSSCEEAASGSWV